MAREVVYRGSILAKNSKAYELWELWQRENKDRNAAQKKLDIHMKEVESKYNPLPVDLVNFKIGNSQ